MLLYHQAEFLYNTLEIEPKEDFKTGKIYKLSDFTVKYCLMEIVDV